MIVVVINVLITNVIHQNHIAQRIFVPVDLITLVEGHVIGIVQKIAQHTVQIMYVTHQILILDVLTTKYVLRVGKIHALHGNHNLNYK